MDIATHIQHYRKQNGLSQEQLADAVSVSRQAVSKWESGQSQPDPEKLLALSQALHISVDTLLTGLEPEAASVAAEEASVEEEVPGQLALDFTALPEDEADSIVFAGPDDKELKTALIVGVAAGAVALVGITSVLRFLFPKRRK